MVVLGGRIGEESNSSYYPVVNDWATYREVLDEAGLSPASGRLLDHSKVVIQSPGADANVMSNGMYDFVLAYYNPKADGSPASGTQDLKARLPSWPASGLTFDGLALPAGYGQADGTPVRAVDGVALDNMNRKGARITSGSPSSYGAGGEPRADFVGNITVPMANYMMDTLNISSLANTNIIGDSTKWNYGSGAKNLYTIPAVNIGIIGDYSAENNFQANVTGVLDIKGNPPSDINNYSGTLNRVNLWGNISYSVNLRVPIVFVGWAGGENVMTGVSGYPTTFARVILYAKKYTGTPNTILKPHHRAFMVNNTPKFTGGSIPSSNTTVYQGSDSTKSIPELDESLWIKFANGEISQPSDIATNYSMLASNNKITQSEFDALSIAAAPVRSGVRFAGGARQVIDAALPAKKKPRFGEAYLAALWE
jgi:hypothetical protein